MKIICVESDHSWESGEVSVQVYESVSELLKNLDVKRQLVEAGWLPIKEIKETQDKAVLENQYYIDPNGHSTPEVNLHLEGNRIVNYLKNGGRLMQKVDPLSVLPPEQAKLVEKAISRNKRLEKARKASAITRAEKSKQRKLEKAKKLLEKHMQEQEAKKQEAKDLEDQRW